MRVVFQGGGESVGQITHPRAAYRVFAANKQGDNGYLAHARITLQEPIRPFHDIGWNLAVADEFRQVGPFGGLEMNDALCHAVTIPQPHILIKLKY